MKIKAMIITAMLLLSYLPMAAVTISYNECSWNSSTNTVDVTKKSRDMSALPDPSNDWIGLGNGWYYVSGEKSCQTVNILGDDVNLVLCDGAKLSCTGGVKLEGNHKLTIYSQSTGNKQGQLLVTQSYSGAAGIGCAKNCEDAAGNIIGMGTLVVHGGEIAVLGSKFGAAIGGGENRGISGSVTIYGGIVKATAGTVTQQRGAGIGGGWCGGQGGPITIYGGEVTAEGKGSGEEGGAGIGGGGGGRSDGGAGGTIRIYGGTVIARSTYNNGGAAIGGGSKHTFDEITISGGFVRAECMKLRLDGKDYESQGAAIGSGYNSSQHWGKINITGGIVMAKGMDGAGIGGGADGNGGEINISGGTVIATSEEGAGIGGGYKGSGGNVTVSGGNVTSYSSQYGAGIGGGWKGNGGTLTVTGGYVTAVGGAITIDWFKDHDPEFMSWKNNATKYNLAYDFLAWIIVGTANSGTYYGAGIGGGDKGKGGTLTVTGGTVHAMGGNTDAPAIGAGRKGDERGNLLIGGNLMVFTGDTDRNTNYRTTDRKEKALSQYNVYISDKTIPLTPYGAHTSDLAAFNGQKKSVMLTWRKFQCGGQYTTLCLPFSKSDLTGTPLEGARIYTVKNTKIVDKILRLELQEAEHKIDAGVPYVVKWDKPSRYDYNPDKFDIETIIFDDVIIDASAPKSVQLPDGTFSGAYDDVDYHKLDSAQVVFNAKSFGTPAYEGYHLGTFYCNFKGKGSSKFGWEKGNYEQIFFSLNDDIYAGEAIRYITHTWDAATGTLERFECICPEVEHLKTSDFEKWSVLDQNKWYLIDQPVLDRKTFEVKSDAYLILRDNTHAFLRGGLKLELGAHLQIFCQSGGSGRLTVTQSYSNTAAIGAALRLPMGSLGIHGGIITATGPDNCTAIGGGKGESDFTFGSTTEYPNTSDSHLYVYGGEITARGGKNAAGIGCSYESNTLDVDIYGGTVKAYGGEEAAGIGGAPYSYYRGPVTIYGGTVEATAGSECVGRDARKGSAIGAGLGTSDKDSGLSIGKGSVNLKVKAGDSADNIERVFTVAEREPACHWRNYAKIEPCNHDDAGALSYTIIDDISHQARCNYCGYEVQEPHNYNNTDRKCPCGKVEDVEPETWTIAFYTAKDATSNEYNEPYEFRVVKGEEFTVPSYDTPDGLLFIQWMVNPPIPPTGIEMKDKEFDPNPEYIGGCEFVPTSDLNLYARYHYDAKEKWTWDVQGALADVSATVEVEWPDGTKTGELTTTIDRNYYGTDGITPAYTRFIATTSYERADGVTYNFSDLIDRYGLTELKLTNNGDNFDKLLKNRYAVVEKLKLEGITFRKDGQLHPLCLPFSLTKEELDASPLAGATFYQQSKAKLADSQLEIIFKKVTDDNFKAGVPYFVKWQNDADILDPEFTNVVIQTAEPGVTSENHYSIVGTLDMLTFDDDDLESGAHLTLNSDEQLVDLPNKKVDAFTAYLYVPHKNDGDGGDAVCSVRLSFEDGTNIDKFLTYGFEGNGTTESPYLIKSARQLNNMAKYFNAGDESMKGKYFKQGANILYAKLMENYFTPVKLFDGHFDGNGYVISEINLNKSGTEPTDDVAMFIRIAEGSTLKNITIANSTFTGRSAAALVHTVDVTATIDNCHLLKDVSVCSNYHAAGGIAAYMTAGNPSVTNCSSQASVTANQSYAGGVVGMLLSGSVTNSVYLGNSVEAGLGKSKSCVVSVNNGGTIENCYYTDPTLSDTNAKLMPDIAVDNTNFLNILHQRDEFLLEGNNGLKEENICYDLTLNGREYKAHKNDDGTWKKWAYAISLPFDMDLTKLENADDITVYKLHEIDTEKKEFIFTNDFPILKAGEPYLVVIGKGSLIFNGKNVLVKEVPLEPQYVMNADGSQELGYWCSNFRRIENEELVEEKAYIMQSNGTYRHIAKVYASKPYVARFQAYFSALEPIGTSFKMKFIQTENGEETSEETDFPADLFYSDCDLGDETGIFMMSDGIGKMEDVWYDLQGRKLSGKPTQKGIYIVGGKKVIVKQR